MKIRVSSILVAALFSLLWVGCANSSNRLVNDEYGVSVVFPNSLIGCTASSGGHAHGFVAHLDDVGRGCNDRVADPSNPAILVYADYNVLFRNSPEAALSGLCERGTRLDALIQDWKAKLQVPGRRTAACAVEQNGETIDVYVVTQAGVWLDKGGSASPEEPYINYMIKLHTLKNRNVGADLGVLSSTVRSVRIIDKKSN